MGININDMRSDEITYTHCDSDTGEYRTFAISRMLEYVNLHRNEIGLYRVPVDKQFAEHIKRNRGLEPHRIFSLLEAQTIEPLLMVRMPDDTTLIVDGNHRYYIAAVGGMQTIKAYVFMWEQAEPFLVTGLTDAQSSRVINGPSGLTEKGEVPKV